MTLSDQMMDHMATSAELSAEMRAELRAARAEIERLREALEKIACLHVTENPLWWQRDARKALGKPSDA